MKQTLIILFLIYTIQVNSQNYNKNYFRSPLNIPIRLAGNFGEIRANHFHSGIDIKVPFVGVQIYAPADGYVSRIRKSADGYGNALYITHPNGLMTVYGHMQKFNKQFEKYAKDIQYKENSFEFTKYPDSTELKVKKGEIIGYAGNTGRSYGPHVHFEVREADKDVPINPCYFNFVIKDNIKPKFFKLMAYALDEDGKINGSFKKQKFKVYKKGSNYFINKTINYSGKIGFSINANDYLNATRNTQGIYSVKLFLDDSLIYEHHLFRIPFEDTRYINSFIDFEERKTTNQKFQKCFIEPGNKLDIYKFGKEAGIINEIENHKIKIEIADIYGNKSNLFFKIKGEKLIIKKHNYKKMFYYNKDNFLEKENFRAYITKGTLYKDIEQTYEVFPKKKDLYSNIYMLNSYKIPAHKKIHIAISTKQLPKNLVNKALIVLIDKNGNYKSLGGSYIDDFLAVGTKQFGKFAIAVDNIPPQIIEENFNEEKDFTSKKKISFKIKDNLSGIGKYSAKIDKKIIIFEYDKKNDRISYAFDNHIDYNKKHVLKIILFDKKNNQTIYKTTFFK